MRTNITNCSLGWLHKKTNPDGELWSSSTGWTTRSHLKHVPHVCSTFLPVCVGDWEQIELCLLAKPSSGLMVRLTGSDGEGTELSRTSSGCWAVCRAYRLSALLWSRLILLMLRTSLDGWRSTLWPVVKQWWLLLPGRTHRWCYRAETVGRDATLWLLAWVNEASRQL